jgi:predicted RNase H-like HicB family nuclease
MSKDAYGYRVYVEPLKAGLGGGFVAYAPELKGCVSDGATPEEALRNIYDAIGAWIADALASGAEVPAAEAPRARA